MNNFSKCDFSEILLDIFRTFLLQNIFIISPKFFYKEWNFIIYLLKYQTKNINLKY